MTMHQEFSARLHGRWLRLARLLVQFAVTARDETDMDVPKLVRVG